MKSTWPEELIIVSQSASLYKFTLCHVFDRKWRSFQRKHLRYERGQDSLSHVDINSSMVHNNGGGTRVQRVGGQPPPKKMIQIQICQRSLSACSLPLPDRLSRSLGFRSGGKSIAGPITAFLCFLQSLSFCLKQESSFSAKFSRRDVAIVWKTIC